MNDHPRTTDPTPDLDTARAQIAALTAERDALKAEVETLRMQLAGCGVAAMANTKGTASERLQQGHPYWSASYGDVCRAVDKQMVLEAHNALLRAVAEAAKPFQLGMAGSTYREQYEAVTRTIEAARAGGAL